MPAEIYDLRQMPDDIKAAFKARGVDPEDTLIVDDPESNKTEFRSVKELGSNPNLAKTLGYSGGKTVLPTLAGAAAGAAGLAGAAALGMPVLGPGSFVPAVGVGVGSALTGGLLASKLQESILDKFAPDMQTEAELLRLANPRTATAGSIIGNFAGGMNSLKGLVSRAGGVKEAAKIASVPTALGAGLEAYNEYRDEGQIDPLRVGLTAAAGPFQAVNTKAGQLAEDIGSSLVGKLSGKIADGQPIAKLRTRDQIAKDILDAHAAGQFTEGSPVYNALAVELNQPGAPADALIKLAQKHAEQNIQNNPEERAKIADMLWESISVKKLPDEQLPQSALELKLASFIKDGVVNSKEELVGLARQSNLDIAANNLRREKAKAAGPAPSTPYTRMEDAQVEALLNASPDVLPPNAGVLDKAIFEGKKKGYVKTAEDIRKLEGAYQVNPEMLPSASRQLWQEKQTPPAVKKAEEAAAAFEKKDIEYFSKEFPKAASEIRRATKNVNDAAALIDDLNTPEDTKAKLRGQTEAAQKSMNESWNNLMKRAFDRYSQIEPPEIGPAPIDPTYVPPPQSTMAAPKPAAIVEQPAIVAKPESTLTPAKPAATQGPEPDYASILQARLPSAKTGMIPLAEVKKAYKIADPSSKGYLEMMGWNNLPKGETISVADLAAHMQKSFSPHTEVRYSGFPGKVVGRALDKTVGRLNDLIFEGTIGPRKVWAGTKSVIDRLRDLGPSGKIIADTDLAMRRDTTKVFNTAAAAYVDAYSSLNKKETSRVDQYLNDTFDTKGHSFIILTPKEQAAVDKIRNDGLLYLVDNGIIRGGPGVREGGMYREQRIDPYYIPTVADSKVRKIVKNREKGYEQLAADWEAWYSGKLGMSADKAKDLMQQYLTATGPSSANDAAKFGALTQAEGVGLPPSWRAPTRKALLYHAYRASKNFAWFTHVQRNPQMAKAVGEMDDGWGGQIDLSTAANDPIADTPAVEAWKQEMNNHLSAPGDWTEDLTRIATAFQLGPLTGLRDIIGTPAHMVELIPGEDLPKVMQALYKVVTSDVRGKMEKAGDIKAKTLQPFEFNASTFSEGVLDNVLEKVRDLNGRNLLESTARQWAYETGRLVGAARLSKGDTAFFEHLKIPNWRELAPEDLFNATGRAFMDSAQGSYNSRGLPDWLLTGPQNKANNFLFSLQRWGVERYNNWHKNAWTPAVKEGDFKPLLRSVFGAMLTSAGLNALQEYLFNQKPPEMKWSEFMKADNKELPYTLFSKLQNVGFAGILSSLGMAAAKVNSGEVPEPVNNLGWDLVLKGSIRTGQFAHALTSRGADAADVFTDYLDSMARDNIQAWRLWQNRTRPDIGNREEKIFKRQQGKSPGMSASMSSLLANPMDPTRDFRQATTEEDMQKALPGLDRALAMDPSKDIRIQSPMRPLNESPSYYDFVGQLQGEEAGQAALQRDQQLERLSLLKRQEVMRAKYRAQTVGGPR
jgi:hypothetical protein